MSGITAYDPIRHGSVLATVNSGVDGFVRGVAVELPRAVRINAVSATVFTEALSEYGASYPGFPSVSMSEGAQAYVKSIEGVQTGKIFCVGY